MWSEPTPAVTQSLSLGAYDAVLFVNHMLAGLSYKVKYIHLFEDLSGEVAGMERSSNDNFSLPNQPSQ